MTTPTTVEVFRLPSEERGGEYDLFCIPPATIPMDIAMKVVNRIIDEVNAEDKIHEDDGGGCDDGASVQENIERRLTEAGYRIVKVSATSKQWDVYDPSAESDAAQAPPVPQPAKTGYALVLEGTERPMGDFQHYWRKGTVVPDYSATFRLHGGLYSRFWMGQWRQAHSTYLAASTEEQLAGFSSPRFRHSELWAWTKVGPTDVDLSDWKMIDENWWMRQVGDVEVHLTSSFGNHPMQDEGWNITQLKDGCVVEPELFEFDFGLAYLMANSNAQRQQNSAGITEMTTRANAADPAGAVVPEATVRPMGAFQHYWRKGTRAPDYDAVFRLRDGLYSLYINGQWRVPRATPQKAMLEKELTAFSSPKFRQWDACEWTKVGPSDFTMDEWTQVEENWWTRQIGDVEVHITSSCGPRPMQEEGWNIIRLKDGVAVAPKLFVVDFGLAHAFVTDNVEHSRVEEPEADVQESPEHEAQLAGRQRQ